MDATSAIRVECSRRGLDAGVAFGSVDPRIARAYQLPPLMVSQYDAAAALRQKVGALAGRRETQARDVFDVHLLLAGGATLAAGPDVDRDVLDRACVNAMGIDFGMFKSQVLAYAVTLARTRRYATPLGVVSLHHVQPTFFFGFEDHGDAGGRLATPEKALVDFLYLAPARSKLFRALPELEWPKRFRAGVARDIVRRIAPDRRRAFVAAKLDALLSARRAR